MFGHFEIIGILLGVEDISQIFKREAYYARVLTEWNSEKNGSDVRHTLRTLVTIPRVIYALSTCRRGDLIIMYGNILSSAGREEGTRRFNDLQAGHVQKLIAGYARHALGRCGNAAPATKFNPEPHADPQKEFADPCPTPPPPK